jgi:hypothetical protein
MKEGTAMATNSKATFERRVRFTPEVVKALREAATAAEQLATHMEAEPGEGIGLSWGPVYRTFDAAQTAMQRYQNDLQHEGSDDGR